MSTDARVASRFAAASADTQRLARAVCLAVRVTRNLLRRARLELTPDLDAGAESDLWFSPLVSSRSAAAIVLDASVLQHVRTELASDRAALDAQYKLVAECHADEPLAIRLEEEIIYRALCNDVDLETNLRELLAPAISAMMSSPERGLGVARWADRAMSGLPDAARGAEPVRLLALGSVMRLGQNSKALQPGNSFTLPQDAGWLLQSSPGASVVMMGVRLLEDGVQFVTAGAPNSGTIELPATDPLLVELSWIEREGYLRVVANQLNLRSQPDTASPRISILPRDTLIKRRDVSPYGNWYAVDVDGQAGWVHSEYVENAAVQRSRTIIPRVDRTEPISSNVVTIRLRTVTGHEYEISRGRPAPSEPEADERRTRIILDLIQSLALAFHVRALEDEGADVVRFYGLRGEQDQADFQHLKQASEYVYHDLAQPYLLEGKDPFEPDPQKQVRDVIDKAIKTSQAFENPRDLVAILRRLVTYATPADRRALESIAGMKLDDIVQRVSVNERDEVLAGAWDSVRHERARFLERLLTPEFVAIAEKYTGPFYSLLGLEKSTLRTSETFADYLEGLTGQWVRHAETASKHNPGASVRVGFSVDPQALNWLIEHEPKLEIETEAQSGFQGETRITYRMSRDHYVRAARFLRTALLEVLPRRSKAKR